MTTCGPRRALVIGWFSLGEVIATVGDLLGAQVTADWLTDAGYRCDVAVAPYQGTGVDWRVVQPQDYELVVFTTGPLFAEPRLLAMLDRFAGCRLWGVNVSMLDAELGGRFERLWSRDGADPDGTDVVRPDQAFLARTTLSPVVAVAFAPPQPEYGAGHHDDMAAVVRHWVQERRLATVELEMDMYAEHRYPRDAGQVDALVARADVVVSMRLHAAVAALRHDRPVIALDPIAGGGKIVRQLAAVGWPCVLPADRCTPEALDAALAWCLTPAAVVRARRSRLAGQQQAARLGRDVVAAARE